MVQEAEGIPVDQQRMIFAGKSMENYMTLDEIGMTDGAVAHLVLRLRGGDSSPGVTRYAIKIDVCGKLILLREPAITQSSPVS